MDYNVTGKSLPNFGDKMLFFVGIDSTLSTALVPVIDDLVKRHRGEYEKLWSDTESKWNEWNTEDILEYFQYQCLPFEDGTIDWSKTRKLLQAQNANGIIIPKINDILLQFMGIHQKTAVDQLLSSIEAMLNKCDGKDKGMKRRSSTKIMESISVDIPEKFVCPISKELMKDPVIAFDGNAYSRATIEDWLKQHKTSPVTGAAAEHCIVVPNNALKQQIAEFVAANGLSVKDQASSDQAVVETGYL